MGAWSQLAGSLPTVACECRSVFVGFRSYYTFWSHRTFIVIVRKLTVFHKHFDQHLLFFQRCNTYLGSGLLYGHCACRSAFILICRKNLWNFVLRCRFAQNASDRTFQMEEHFNVNFTLGSIYHFKYGSVSVFYVQAQVCFGILIVVIHIFLDNCSVSTFSVLSTLRVSSAHCLLSFWNKKSDNQC